MKKGQIWIETVIYTLIALVLIGAVLTFVKPKIEEIQDKAIIDQTIAVMNGIDEQINSVRDGGAGNKRILEMELKKGEINIYCKNSETNSDKIIYTLENTRSVYSEPGIETPYGSITILTESHGKLNNVKLILNYYGSINLKCNGDDLSKKLTKSSSKYKLEILNQGAPSPGASTIINIEV